MSSDWPGPPSHTPIGPGVRGPMYASAKKPGRSTGYCLALGCGGAVLVAVAITLVLIAFVGLGMGVFTEQVKANLRDHPVIVEHLGRLESLEIEWMASLQTPGRDEFVFRAKGTLGTGIIRATCVTVDQDTEKVVAGTLQLESGEVIDLFPDRSGS